MRAADGPVEQRTDKDGLLRTSLDAKLTLRRVTDSNLLLVGSLGAANPTDASFIPVDRTSRKRYIDFAACLLH